MATNNSYQSILNNDEAKAFLQNRGKELVDYGQQKLLELKKYADEGDFSWKLLAFFGGLGLMAVSALSFLSHLTGIITDFL